MIELTALDADFARRFPNDFAEELASQPPEKVLDLLAALPADLAAGVAVRLPVAELMPLLEGDWATRVLASASVDNAVAVLARLPRESARSLVERLPEARRRRPLLQFLNFPPHAVGAHAVAPTACVTAATPIKDVLAAVTDSASEPAVIVTDETNRYVGVLDLWRTLAPGADSRPAGGLAQWVRPLRAATSVASSLPDSVWGSRAWLPVVDHRSRVVGVCWRHSLRPQLQEAELRTLGATGGELLGACMRAFLAVLDGVLARRA